MLSLAPLFILPSLGTGELVIILVVVLVLFGPGKLPHVFKTFGNGMREFKQASNPSQTKARPLDSEKPDAE